MSKKILTRFQIVGFLLFTLASATAQAAAQNLVINGSFEAGNTAFTSSYDYSPAGNGAAGEFTVSINPFPWNGQFISAGDHTSGSGQMFIANGGPTDGGVVWQSGAISVNASTNYFFEAFVMNVCCKLGFTGPNSASILDFMINDVSVGIKTTNLSNAGTWEGLSTNWNSGGATTAVLKLVNRNTAGGGNDFALDDINLSVVSTVTPVPEPEIYAMMLAGLGLMGFAARKRKQSS